MADGLRPARSQHESNREQELGAAIRYGQRLSADTVTDSLLEALTLAYREANGLAPE